MGRNILILLLVFSFCFLGFSIGRFTYFPPTGPNVSVAKDIPDLKDMPDVERALTMAIIASSGKLAKDMAKTLDKQNLSREAYQTFINAAKGMNSKPKEADPNKIYKLSQGNAPSKGPDDAPITIYEFSEFQCPFCSRAYVTIEELMKEYDGKIKLVFRSKLLPNHSKAPLAHAAAYAAKRQGKFWEMYEKIFANQKDLSEEAFVKYAGEIGLDSGKFNKDLHDPNIADDYKEDVAEAGRLGITSTPTFFINGKMVRGAKPKDAFKQVIDEALKAAQK